MALDPESPALPASKTEYTCPMHPEVVRAGAGELPHLRHGTRAAHGDVEEDESRTARHDAPLLDQPGSHRAAAGDCHGRACCGRMRSWCGRSWSLAVERRWSSMLPWLELLLATPVVLWCGWPFFQRGWASVVNRSTNMFTLIAMGTGVAYLFSVVATLVPADISGVIPQHGRTIPDVYFEAAAAIVTLVLLGQVLELRARSQTSSAIRALLDLSPKMARLCWAKTACQTAERDIPLEQVKPGDRLRVRPGEKIPVDGVVLDGSSAGRRIHDHGRIRSRRKDGRPRM
jgi:P-type Cu+ transporter